MAENTEGPWNDQMHDQILDLLEDLPDDLVPVSLRTRERTGYENLSFDTAPPSARRDPRTPQASQLNDDRFRHTAIIGRTGSGKSNLVHQMEREDIRKGSGVFVLAAHEEDALYPLACVPEERLGDVVLLELLLRGAPAANEPARRGRARPEFSPRPWGCSGACSRSATQV